MQHGAGGAIELRQSTLPVVIRRREPTMMLDLIRVFDKTSSVYARATPTSV